MTADLYAVLGNPIEHSRSPWIHARFAQLTGQAIAYEKQLVPLDGLRAALDALRERGARGCNVTVPFKIEAAALATERTDRARLAGACNTVRFDGRSLLGDNSDGAGLVRDLQRQAPGRLEGADLLLVGAGGAASGVLGPLLQARPRRVVLANRTVSKARALVEAHEALARDCGVDLSASGLDTVDGRFDLVVNATASSLGGGGIPVPGRVLAPGALAYDMMYGPAAAPFLAWARDHGAVASDGLGMLVEQAAESFFVWRGARPPTDPVLAELRTLLTGA